MNPVWLTWRQHRAALIAMTLWVAAPTALLVLQPSTNDPVDSIVVVCEVALGGFVGVFWGAPLVAREYEQGTHLFTWSQDVTPGRWLISRATHLLAVVAVLAFVLGAVSTARFGAVHSGFELPLFEMWPPLQVAYAVFGLTLGIAMGALVRRTVFAMGLTVIGFVIVRAFVSVLPFPVWLSDADRLVGQLIESGIFVALAAALLFVAWRLVRRQEVL